MRFIDWLAARLAQSGSRVAFGVPGGGSSLDLMRALRNEDISLVITAREDAAVIMAGISGALAGGPGVAFCTKGPGLASAANGLACAALDRLPSLLVAESFAPEELSYVTHQVFDQNALAQPLLDVPAGEVLEANTASVESWLQQPLSPPRGPAVLLASGRDHAVSIEQVLGYPDPPVTLNATALRTARAQLGNTRRPVVILGLEASRGVRPSRIRAFVEALGAPVLCTYMAKGVIADNHPQWAGLFTGGSIEQSCVAEADLIITIGLDPVELIRKRWPYTAPVLDVCEHVHRPHYFEPAARLCLPLGESLTVLMDGLARSTWDPAEIDAHRNRFLQAMSMSHGNALDASAVVRQAATSFGAKPRVAVDAGAHMFSACALWPCDEPLDLLISNGLATMGFALPAAIAAALHDRERGAVALTGDGGLLMCLGELKTIAETGAKVCVVVFNDARLSLIDVKREERQMQDLGMSWQAPDFAAVARGFGLEAWRVERIEDLRAALDAAAALPGPSLVDARIDASGYGEQLKVLRG